MDTWILRMLRRKYRRQLVAWTLAAAVAVLLGAVNARYLLNFARGPFAMSPGALDSVADAATAPRYFVRVTPDTAFETGLREITTETVNGAEVRSHVTAEYYVAAVGHKFLVVKSAAALRGQAAGALVPLSDEIVTNLFDTPQKRAARGRFYPFYLDAASSFRAGGYWALGVGLAFLALLVWRGRIAWAGLRDPESDPVAQRVARWGDPVTAAALVEHELQELEPRKWGAWTLTRGYLVQRSFFGFNVLRWRDLLWAHKKVTQRRVNFIPAGKEYAALLYCYGGNAVLRGSEKKVDELLQEVPQRAPWAALGWSKDLEQLWSKRNADFCAAVEARRAGEAR